VKQFLFSIFIYFFISTYVLSQEFDFRVDKGIIESEEIVEASGLAASRKNPGVLWTHNDSGGKSKVFAFDSLGKNLGHYLIAGIQNRDWEDIAVGPGSIEGKQYLYIGDIGDNSLTYTKKHIYRIPEPYVSVDQSPIDTILYNAERLVFQYPDGIHNSETLMIHPLSLDIYIVSKEKKTKVYKVSWPYEFYSLPTFNVDTLEIVTDLPFQNAVGGDISAGGDEILIKSKNAIYYWKNKDDQTVEEALLDTIKIVPYIKEPNGEAVCWAYDLSGYYTISEGFKPHLYFYSRILTNIVQEENRNYTIFRLEQNYPNPFNPSTTIKYSIPKQRDVTLKVYDLLGSEVLTLVNKLQFKGKYEVDFDGSDLTSGIYFYRLQAGDFVETKKMILMK